MKPLSKFQKSVLAGEAADKVLLCLEELEEEWKREMEKEAKNLAADT